MLNDEIARIENSKADLKSAIEQKGVSVAPNETIDFYAEKIREIQTGADISPWTEILQGEFTPASDINRVQIEGTQGMAKHVNMLFICYIKKFETNKYKTIENAQIITILKAYNSWGSVYTIYDGTYNKFDYSLNKNKRLAGSGGDLPKTASDKVELVTAGGDIKYKAGETYKWIYLR